MSDEQPPAPATTTDVAGEADEQEGAAPREGRDLGQRLPSGLRYCLAVYLITRIPVVAGTWLFLLRHPGSSIQSIAVTWDGYWYTHIAKDGYSASLRPPAAVVGPSHHTLSDWAFFPGYPLLIRAVGELTQIPLIPASLLVATVLGVLAVWAVYAVGEAYGGVRVAQGAALLVAAWPGSASFNLPYTEGLFLAAAGACLLGLHRRWWLAAGLAGAVASAARANGVALVAAAVVAAVLAIVHAREWRAVLAPVLTASGAGAFVLYGWQRTGDPLVWRHAENLWRQQLDFNQAVLRTTIRLFGNVEAVMRSDAGALALVTATLRVSGLLLVLAMLGAAWANRRHLSAPAWAPMSVYTLVSLAIIGGYSAVSTRPRMVLTVLPGFVWLAAWLPRRVTIAVAICLLPIVGVVTYAWATGVVP